MFSLPFHTIHLLCFIYFLPSYFKPTLCYIRKKRNTVKECFSHAFQDIANEWSRFVVGNRAIKLPNPNLPSNNDHKKRLFYYKNQCCCPRNGIIQDRGRVCQILLELSSKELASMVNDSTQSIDARCPASRPMQGTIHYNQIPRSFFPEKLFPNVPMQDLQFLQLSAPQ